MPRNVIGAGGLAYIDPTYVWWTSVKVVRRGSGHGGHPVLDVTGKVSIKVI